ncbi:hypothetical protein N5U22_03215 [Aliarcobacter cryaerophilus]|nr:hypothetical protein [Aliarcobacter cryaerophilus]
MYKFFSFDGTEESIERMMKIMPPSQKIEFFKDFDLVSDAYYNFEYKLIGFSKDDIKSEAIKIRKYIATENIKFLNKYIEKLQKNNVYKSYLHFSKHGDISAPRQGHIYDKEFTIDEMKDIVKYKGDYNSYKYIQEFKEGFFRTCKDNLCDCTFEKMVEKYPVEDIKNFEKLSDKEMSNIFLDLVNSCKNVKAF